MNNNALLHLSLISGVGSVTIASLKSHIKNWHDIYDASPEMLMSCGLSSRMSYLIYDKLKNRDLLTQEHQYMKNTNTRFCSSGDFPPLLTSPSPPPIMYFKGDLEIFNNRIPISCIASRDATQYTVDTASKLFKYLDPKRFIIVSGGAIGGDTIIHETALQYGIPTFAIIGSGINSLYPTQNSRLFDRMCKQAGGVISPFSMNTKPRPGTFHSRNSVIASISKATIVIQAAAKSGALITANYAKKYNLPIGAVPGSIYDTMSEGCNTLIKNGSHVITSTSDIYNMLSLAFNNRLSKDKKDESNLENCILQQCTQWQTTEQLETIFNENLQEILFELMISNKI